MHYDKGDLLLSIAELKVFLENKNCTFKILIHDAPIISTHDAAKYFDITKAAPIFIMDTEKGLIAPSLLAQNAERSILRQQRSFGDFQSSN